MQKSLIAPLKAIDSVREAILQKTDILCIQETHFAHTKAPSCQHRLFPHHFFANASKKARGVMIDIRNSIAFQLHHTEADPLGRYLILSASFNNSPLVIAYIYAPNTHQNSFFKSVLAKLQPFPKDQIIIYGDFNDITDLLLETSSPSRKRSTSLSSLFQSEDLYDPWYTNLSVKLSLKRP